MSFKRVYPFNKVMRRSWLFTVSPINPEYASAENCKTVVKAYKSGEQGIYANNAYGAEFWEVASADQLPINNCPAPF